MIGGLNNEQGSLEGLEENLHRTNPAQIEMVLLSAIIQICHSDLQIRCKWPTWSLTHQSAWEIKRHLHYRCQVQAIYCRHSRQLTGTRARPIDQTRTTATSTQWHHQEAKITFNSSSRSKVIQVVIRLSKLARHQEQDPSREVELAQLSCQAPTARASLVIESTNKPRSYATAMTNMQRFKVPMVVVIARSFSMASLA